MVDTYTKVILTVIALSLSTIAFKGMFVTNAHAELDPYDLSAIERYLKSIDSNTCRTAINTSTMGHVC